ncbi:MAG: acyl carrier protein [Patescibacteria group bacterium]|nr:acyl carrier protein [Patescibacteria group bacterium]
MKIFEHLQKLISLQWGIPENQISLESYLTDDLNADPISLADFVVCLENEFKVCIPQEEIAKFNTVEDIVNFLSDHVN